MPPNSTDPPNPLPPPITGAGDVKPKSSDARFLANMNLLEPGEEMVTVIYRHPIGLILIYLEAMVAILALLALTLVLAPNLFNDLTAQSYGLVIAGLVFGTALMVFILFIATYIYRQNRLLVTSRSLVEVLQRGLFVRKVSRLSLTNVEDVSADQRGILASLFNFGTLLIQTAGTIENFAFKFCPDPNQYARRILEAREAYAESLREETNP